MAYIWCITLTPLEPVTPSDPCDRVKFILGSEDTESANHDPTVHTIFTELEELKYDENDHQKYAIVITVTNIAP